VTTSSMVLFGLLLLGGAHILGCGASPRSSSLVEGLSPAPPAHVAAGCELATRRCTRCHPVERLLHARVRTPEHWKRYVARMRLMPGSGISAPDGDQILSCLVFRSFGADGLAEFRDGQGGAK